MGGPPQREAASAGWLQADSRLTRVGWRWPGARPTGPTRGRAVRGTGRGWPAAHDATAASRGQPVTRSPMGTGRRHVLRGRVRPSAFRWAPAAGTATAVVAAASRHQRKRGHGEPRGGDGGREDLWEAPPLEARRHEAAPRSRTAILGVATPTYEPMLCGGPVVRLRGVAAEATLVAAAVSAGGYRRDMEAAPRGRRGVYTGPYGRSHAWSVESAPVGPRGQSSASVGRGSRAGHMDTLRERMAGWGAFGA